MASFLSQTLIRTTASPACLFSAAKPRAIRCLSTQPESTSFAASEAEAKVMEKIEDMIHGIIVNRSKPDWLPFVPGASYWAPPRRSSYGVADVVHKLDNALTDEDDLSLITLRGCPSPTFYIHNDASYHLDLEGTETSAVKTFHEVAEDEQKNVKE